MKKWMNDKYTTIAIYVLLVLLATLLFSFAILNLGRIWDIALFLLFSAKSVVFGILIALVLFPLCSVLEKGLSRFAERRLHKTWRPFPLRATAVSLAYLIALILVGIVIVSILPMLNQNYDQLQSTLTGYVNSLLALLQKNDFIYDLIVSIVGVSGQTAQEFINNLLVEYSGYLSSFASNLVNVLTVVITSTSDVIVALILSFYFLLSRNTIAAITRKIAAAVLPDRFRTWSARFFRRLYSNVFEFLSARILCSFLLGVLCYLLTWALNIPFYPLLSLIVFVLNIIPFFGPFVAALLCTVIIAIVQPEVTWIFVLILLLINLTEQFLIERSLLSKRLRPNMGVTLAAVLLFNQYFGFMGAILAVPIWVSVATEVRAFLNRRLRKKGVPLSPDGAPIICEGEGCPEEEESTERATPEEGQEALPDYDESETTWMHFKSVCLSVWKRIKRAACGLAAFTCRAAGKIKAAWCRIFRKKK